MRSRSLPIFVIVLLLKACTSQDYNLNQNFMSQQQTQSNILYTGIEDKETNYMVNFEFIFRVLFSDIIEQSAIEGLDKLEEKLSQKYFSDITKLQQNYSMFYQKEGLHKIDADSFIGELLGQINQIVEAGQNIESNLVDIKHNANQFKKQIQNFDLNEQCEKLRENQDIGNELIDFLCDQVVLNMEQETFSLVVILDQYIKQFEEEYANQQLLIETQIIKLQALPKLNKAQKDLLMRDSILTELGNIENLLVLLKKFKKEQTKILTQIKSSIKSEKESAIKSFQSFYVNWKQLVRLVQVNELKDTLDIKKSIIDVVQRLYQSFLSVYIDFQEKVEKIQTQNLDSFVEDQQISSQDQENIYQYLKTFVPLNLVLSLQIKDLIKQNSIERQDQITSEENNLQNQKDKGLSLIEIRLDKSKSSKQGNEGTRKQDLKMILLQNKAKMISEGNMKDQL